MKKIVVSTFILFFAIMTVFPLTAFAEAKQLKLASWGASKHYAAIEVSAWVKDVNEALAGQYEITEYPGGQLYGPKEMHVAVGKGSVELGVILQPAALGTVPLLQGVYLPFGIDSLDQIAKAYSGESMEIIDKALQKKRIKMISVLYFSPTQIFCISKNINKVEDFKGLRVLSQSPIVTQILAKLGSAPDTSIPQTEHYMALKRGVSEASLTGIVGGYFTKISEPAPFVTKLNFSFPTAFIAMNTKVFYGMPEKAQKTVLELGQKHSNATLQMVKGWDAKFTQVLMQTGVTVTTLPEAERAKIKTIARQSWTKWAEKNGPEAQRLLELNSSL